MKKNITRILALVLSLACLFALTACGEKKTDGDKTAEIVIAVPNDTTNEARALLLLDTLGYI